MLAATPSVVRAQNVLVHDNPWGAGYTLNNAFNDVFGAGNYQQLGYSGLNAATLFSAANKFIYLEGGDGTESAFNNFINANGAAMTNWVAGGGRLIVNAATWGVTVNTAFGVQLQFSGYPASMYDGYAVNGGDPLFQDMGYGPTGTHWTGNLFAHNWVVGPASLTKLIVDGANNAVLSEMDWGNGHVMFGGITTDNFHGPSAEAQALTRNIIDYGATTATPEPATIALMATGLFAVGVVTRRRRTAVTKV
jgi:hypothetical protein